MKIYKKYCGILVMGETALSSGWLGFQQEERGRQSVIGRGNSLSKGPEIWPDLGYMVETGKRQVRDQGQAIPGLVWKAIVSWKAASEAFSWQAEELETCLMLCTVQPRAQVVESF